MSANHSTLSKSTNQVDYPASNGTLFLLYAPAVLNLLIDRLLDQSDVIVPSQANQNSWWSIFMDRSMLNPPLGPGSSRGQYARVPWMTPTQEESMVLVSNIGSPKGHGHILTAW
ncbi:hypothetical protein [Marmot herpesvirus 1]|nr:hypothetical protein [Marmot herpesvirus 1]